MHTYGVANDALDTATQGHSLPVQQTGPDKGQHGSSRRFDQVTLGTATHVKHNLQQIIAKR